MSAGGKRIDMKVNLAHLCINDETHEEHGQSLRDHNRKVGEYASGALNSVGFSSLGMLAGILHDGKGGKRKSYIRGLHIHSGKISWRYDAGKWERF